ncbi:MAG: TenA family transcriptional regulator [Thermoproteus sp.]|nr:TenA family transcriptional regulator [Thermoproteus sp.]
MAGLIEEIRRRVAPLNAAILEAPAVRRPDERVVRRFVANQLYIVPSDLKALSSALARAHADNEYKFIKRLIDGDYEAFFALRELAEELGVRAALADVDPAAVAYTHFLTWLAAHGTPGDLAVAMTINLPVWGAGCAALSKWLRERGYRKTRFLDAFSGPYDELEAAAEAVALRYLDQERYLYIAKAIQTYECLFWYSISDAPLDACRARAS